MAFTLLKDKDKKVNTPAKKTGKFTLLKDQTNNLPKPVTVKKPIIQATTDTPYLGQGIRPTNVVLPSIKKAVDAGNAPTFDTTPIETPKPPTLGDTAKSAGKGVFNAFTSSSQAFGRTLGTAASVVSPTLNREREATLASNNAQIDHYLKMAKDEINPERKKMFLKAAQKLQGDNAPTDVFTGDEYQKTGKQIAGEALGTVTEAMIGSFAGKTATGAKAVAQTGVKQGLKAVAKDTLINITAPSIAYGVASGMQKDKDLGGIAKEGLASGALGTALGVGIQAGAGAIMKKLASVEKGIIKISPEIDDAIKPQVTKIAKEFKRAGINKVVTEDDVIKSQLKPFNEWLADEAKIAKPDSKTAEAIRKKIAFNVEPDAKTIKQLKKDRIGVDEIPFDADGNITLYREGKIKDGKLQSYSLTKKWDGQKPVVVNKKDVILNTSSDELDNLYDLAYQGDELATNKKVLNDYRNLEGEVLVAKQSLPKPSQRPQNAQGATTTNKMTNVSSKTAVVTTEPKITTKETIISELKTKPKKGEFSGIYNQKEKNNLIETVVKPKVEALGEIKPNETVVFYQGAGKNGQYVNTKPDKIWDYTVDDNLVVKKVKTSSLKSTGDIARDELGYRKLSVKLPKQTKITENVVEVAKPKEPNTFTSRVFKRMQAERPDILDGDLEVQKINLKNEAIKAEKILKENKQKLYDIAMGKESSNEVTSSMANITLAERAIEEGNNDLAAKLIRNRSLAQTRRGQEIVSEKASLTDNSASRYIKELIGERLDDAGVKYTDGLKDVAKKSNKERAIAKIDTDVANLELRIKNKKITTKEALSLLDKITCLV